MPRIARCVESSHRLGRHRCVEERSFAWLYRNRRLLVRHYRDAELYRAFIYWQLLPPE